MLTAKIMSHTDDGVVCKGTIAFDGKKFSADTPVAQKFVDRTAFWNGEALTQADGEKFLRALPLAYRNSSSFAIVLDDDKDIFAAGGQPERKVRKTKPPRSSVPILLQEMREEQ